VAWIHTTAGLPTITVHPFVKATLEGLQRMLAKPVVKKEPTVPLTDNVACIAVRVRVYREVEY